MPLCTLHLIALHSTTPNPVPTFLSTLKSANISPLVISRVIRWIILPSKLSTEHLLARNIHWDLLLILPSTDALPSSLSKLVQHHWSVTAGVPSRLIQDFASKNQKLLHPDPSSVPKVQEQKSNKTTESSQSLELSDELNKWIQTFVNSGAKEGKGAVSMFNLLAFNPGMKEEYLKYGAAFAKSIGSKHGGNAKIVGNATHVNGSAIAKASDSSVGTNGEVGGGNDDWDEIALAHYPSILHFRDMLASEDYQEVNHRHRVPSLRDTCILMTSETAVEELMGQGKGGAKL
ncbi:uncharacterized protein J4E92_002781 [Alternaria infectoria]|uniref:uncharacterized protein n=1 Tax=Alternaria infectoria TaxID=45303 RepID=UPI00221FC092|nr:uncharacterized protein J4E92_002781 [Alternaria infectoria]KAI4935491.1 hypothetical protein J4E92_002781 [Alternaria infectoria]